LGARFWEKYEEEPRLTGAAWRPAVPAGSVLLLLRPGVDEAAVESHGVLRGDALQNGWLEHHDRGARAPDIFALQPMNSAFKT